MSCSFYFSRSFRYHPAIVHLVSRLLGGRTVQYLSQVCMYFLHTCQIVYYVCSYHLPTSQNLRLEEQHSGIPSAVGVGPSGSIPIWAARKCRLQPSNDRRCHRSGIWFLTHSGAPLERTKSPCTYRWRGELKKISRASFVGINQNLIVCLGTRTIPSEQALIRIMRTATYQVCVEITYVRRCGVVVLTPSLICIYFPMPVLYRFCAIT